ncbi:hypothetical protein D1BOALGB6SA_10056 [Olavius sp. associated proteobacterium Delta 1]|nr:hypothetical protein D1BOALGB6SA_10056 [Olavius sp. associated proteobacterium Delta 1]
MRKWEFEKHKLECRMDMSCALRVASRVSSICQKKREREKV